jgi:hypothetical protein
MVIAGWMYWDAELHNWRPIVTTSRDTTLEAFEREPDPPTLKCRPCNENSHLECEGPDLCGCSMCRDIQPTVEDMSEIWDLYDKAKQWPD